MASNSNLGDLVNYLLGLELQIAQLKSQIDQLSQRVAQQPVVKATSNHFQHDDSLPKLTEQPVPVSNKTTESSTSSVLENDFSHYQNNSSQMLPFDVEPKAAAASPVVAAAAPAPVVAAAPAPVVVAPAPVVAAPVVAAPVVSAPEPVAPAAPQLDDYQSYMGPTTIAYNGRMINVPAQVNVATWRGRVWVLMESGGKYWGLEAVINETGQVVSFNQANIGFWLDNGNPVAWTG